MSIIKPKSWIGSHTGERQNGRKTQRIISVLSKIASMVTSAYKELRSIKTL
jgi:hypothetical protein